MYFKSIGLHFADFSNKLKKNIKKEKKNFQNCYLKKK